MMFQNSDWRKAKLILNFAELVSVKLQISNLGSWPKNTKTSLVKGKGLAQSML